MKVKLISENILKYSYTEEELSFEYSKTESFYLIRKLKATIKSVENGGIEVLEPDKNGQVYSDEFSIWFQDYEYKII